MADTDVIHVILLTSILHASSRCVKSKPQRGLKRSTVVVYTDCSYIKLVIMYRVDFAVILGRCIIKRTYECNDSQMRP